MFRVVLYRRRGEGLSALLDSIISSCVSLSHIVFHIDIDILLQTLLKVSSKVIKIKFLCNYAVPEWRSSASLPKSRVVYNNK